MVVKLVILHGISVGIKVTENEWIKNILRRCGVRACTGHWSYMVCE